LFTYVRSEPELWTIGSLGPDGKWAPESDHGTAEEAARRCAWLNGGDPEPAEAEAGEPSTFDEWCIVELLGHRRLAGRVREVQVAGSGFLRLDIPAAGVDPARTQYVSPGSVYALHPVGESTARAAAGRWRPEPIQRWELAAVAAAQPTREDVEDLVGDGPF
jgi:hypothetical protein